MSTRRPASFEPQVRNLQQRLFDAYAAEVRRVSGNDEGIITALQGDIDTPTDGFADNERGCTCRQQCSTASP